MRLERTMKRTLLTSLILGPALLFVALLIPGAAAAAGPITTASSCSAAGSTVTCNLWAEAGTLALPGTSVPVWGFATTSGGSPIVPGPVLVVNQGDTVTVNLTNHLSQLTSILFDGQAMVPDLAGGRRRTRSRPVPPAPTSTRPGSSRARSTRWRWACTGCSSSGRPPPARPTTIP
jgi:FtsP/CotA-like multicopper oxidase with cupredoxin domain